jgi:hypothetical protein
VLTALAVVAVSFVLEDKLRKKSEVEAALGQAREYAKATINLASQYNKVVVSAFLKDDKAIDAVDQFNELGWGFGIGKQKIPVPFNFVKKWNEQNTTSFADGSKVQVFIYSKYPFKDTNRSEPDRWREKTLTDLENGRGKTENSHDEVTDKFGNLPGRFLRYAEVIRMKEGCSECHNALNKKHKLWPGKEWKKGDIRAIVDVTIMLGQ